MSAIKASEAGDTDSSNAVSTHEDELKERVSGSGSEGDVERASSHAEPKGKSKENEKYVKCKDQKRLRQTLEKEQ